MNDNPRHLLFNDIFNNQRISIENDNKSDIEFQDLISNHDTFISSTIKELKSDLDKYSCIYNNNDINKQENHSTKPNIVVNTNVKKHSSRISSISSQSSSQKKISTHNPQYLSKVANILIKVLPVNTNIHPKLNKAVNNSCYGYQIVDYLMKIIKTNDRALATIYARSLQQQNVIVDIATNQKFRDNHHDLYTLNTSQRVNGVFIILTKCYSPTCTRDKSCYSLSCPNKRLLKSKASIKKLHDRKSSNTNTPISAKPSMIFKQNNIINNINQNYNHNNEEKTLWSSSVPESILSSISSKELKRQEAIYEVYITEKNFVKSLETIRDSIIKTLAETNIIPQDIRKNFIKHVFAHVNDIYSVNKRFLDALKDRIDTMYTQNYLISGIGDVLLKWIPFFEPFVFYIASRPYAKYLMETQRQVNPYFSRFDEDLMNSKLRHGIDSFLSQGVSRPGRYVLLVKEIIKNTNNETKEYETLNKCLEQLNSLMKRIDKASGAAQDRHDVILLKQKILFKNEFINLGLNDEKRRIRHEGSLFRNKINTLSSSSTNIAQNFNNVGDIQFYLLDNVLLFLKSKAVNKWNQHKVFQRPIPLPLLFVISGEDMNTSLRKYIGYNLGCSGAVLDSSDLSGTTSFKKNDNFNFNSGITNTIKTLEEDDIASPSSYRRQSSNSIKDLTQISKASSLNHNTLAITFLYYGAKQRYQITLYGGQIAAITTLMDKIKQEQMRLIQNYNIFNLYKLSEKVFDNNNKIISLESFDNGKKNLVLTNQSISMCTMIEKPIINSKQFVLSPPLKLVNNFNNKIQQIAVVEDLQILLLLIDKKLYYVKMMILNDIIGQKNTFEYLKQNSKELLTNCTMFKIGKCANKDLIVTITGSIIKFFELNNLMNLDNVKNKLHFTTVTFDSEPISISFLKNNLCIGCKKGFQIVSVTQNAHEPLLDPADTSLEFAIKQMNNNGIGTTTIVLDNGSLTTTNSDTSNMNAINTSSNSNNGYLRPMEIYRIGNNFLLNYQELSFFVNSQGWRKKDSNIIYWEGIPQHFCLYYPYILAFNTNFIEIRYVETGELIRCIIAEKIRLLKENKDKNLDINKDKKNVDNEILYAYEDDRGYDVVASIKFI
ncbi:related to RHO1 GDP-GTP exchange protein 2 [Hanseniaspora guilliermondii]|uniref:Related to RHO1 GDP-GTP exchange protein 2 n=1 Tax=Hanseniaspora guilliermondii TaxID=56406 RepID=A0A1L0CHN7_9ASCO|nr:related to RHO1 GDP-GTP exchange protein 2 [Hanseniaspora guilliermondii]